MSDRVISSIKNRPVFEGFLVYLGGIYVALWSLQGRIAIYKDADYDKALETYNLASSGRIANHNFTLKDVKEVVTTYPNLKPFLVGFFDWNGDEDSLPPVPEETSQKMEHLKASCYYCQVDIYATQRFVWNSDKYEIDVHCNKCSRRDTIKLSVSDIKKANEGGGWQAFLGK